MNSPKKISDILLKIIKIGAFSILLLPPVINSTFFFPFIVPKNILFRIIAEIIFILYLILAHINQAYRPKFDKISWSVFSFLGISTLATFAGIGVYNSFWGNYERMSGLFHLIHLVMYFFVLANVFKTKKDWYSFFTFSVFVSVIMCFIGFAQWLKVPFLMKSSGGDRISATVGNPTFFAAYLLFNLFFLFYFAVREKRFNLKLFSWSFLAVDVYLIVSSLFYKLFSASNWQFFNFLKVPILTETFSYTFDKSNYVDKFPPLFLGFFILLQVLIFLVWYLQSRRYFILALLTVIFLFDFFIFFNTQTRGAIVGLALGLCFLAFGSLFLAVNKKIKIISLVCLVIIVVSPFILFALKNSSFIKTNGTLNRLATISLNDITTESRLNTWQASWKGWTETPKSFLIGYGPENYYYAFNKNFPVEIYKDNGSQIWFDRAHNIIFDVGVTTGILGLAAYLAVLILAIIALIRVYRNQHDISQSWLLIGLLIAYFTQNLFVFDTLSTEILFYPLLAFIVFLAGLNPKDRQGNEEKENLRSDINYVYVISLLLVLAFVISAVNVRTVEANAAIFKGITAPLCSSPDNKCSAAQINKNIDTKFGYFKQAIEQALPGRFEARQQLSNFAVQLAQNQNIDQAKSRSVLNYTVTELQKSVNEEPLNFRHRLWLGSVYNSVFILDQTAPQKALQVMQAGIDLSPTRPQLYFEMGQSYGLLGNFDQAIEYFKKGVALSPEVLDSNWNLLSIYIVTSHFDLADQEYQTMLKLGLKPGVNEYQRLISLYSRVKKYDKMIELFNQLIKIDESSDNYAQLASLYAKIGENQKAKAATEKAVSLNPASAAEAKVFLDQLQKGELLDKTK
ncbi:MAG: O-antigen ligase family protein [Patescibacteria group bacterium]|jgi:tetratricopeptide (TPR) repeat protein